MFNIRVADRVLALVREMGVCVLDDRTRLRGLLLDYCLGCSREVDLLLMISEMGFISRLKCPESLSELDVFKYEKQLQDRKSVTADAARWGISTWMYALSGGKKSGCDETENTKSTENIENTAKQVQAALAQAQAVPGYAGKATGGGAGTARAMSAIERYATNGYARVTKHGHLYFVDPTKEIIQEKVIEM